MAAPTSNNEVTARRLSRLLVGADGNGGLWGKLNTKFDNRLDRYDAVYTRSNIEGDGWVKLAESPFIVNPKQRDFPFVWDVVISKCQSETTTEQLCLNVRYETSGLPGVSFRRYYTVDRTSSHKFAVRTFGAGGTGTGKFELWAYLHKFWGSIAIREIAGSNGDTNLNNSDPRVFATYYSYYQEGGSAKPVSDLANNIQVIDSNNFKFAMSSDLTSAITALDVASVGGAGKYISAISETDGKISATATSMDTTPTAGSTNAVTSGGIKTALDSKVSSLTRNGSTITPSGGVAALGYMPITRQGTSSGATVQALIQEIRVKPGGSMGSSYITASTVGSLSIPAGWYNYIWIPHVRGAASGDEQSYGSLVITLMTDTPDVYVIEGSALDGSSPQYRAKQVTGDFRTIVQDSSKGANLVVNGSGRMTSNYNFSAYTYLPTICYNGSAGSFGFNVDASTNEFISCDFNKKIIFSADVKNLVAQPSNCIHRICVYEYDIDKKTIQAQMVMFGIGTLTELTQDLNPGDTVVHLANLSNANWISTTTYHRGFIFWNYQNSHGYLYPPETYSRNVYPVSDSSSLWDVANVNVSAGTITLNSAWTGPAIPAGTKVSRRSSGNNFPYPAQQGIANTEWYSLKGYIQGVVAPGTSERVSTKFSQGTAFIRVGMLPTGLSNTDTVTGKRAVVTNLFVYEEQDINDGFGTLPVNRGGTGATQVTGSSGALHNLTNDQIGTASQWFLTITNGWNRCGYCSVADAKTVLGLKDAAFLDTGTSSGTVATGDHTHSEIYTPGDRRDTATAPTNYNNKLKFAGMKRNSVIGNPSSDTYSYIVGLRGWNNYTGGFAHELAFNNTGIFSRTQTGSDEATWGSWSKLYTSSNLTSQSPSSGGTTVSLCTNGEKATWNAKQDALTVMTDTEVSDLLAAMA